MISAIIDLASLVILAGILLSLGWAAWKYFRPGDEQTPTGKVIEKVTDTAQDFAALGALRLLRWQKEVEGAPTVLAAWGVIYEAFGGKTEPKQYVTNITIPPKQTDKPTKPAEQFVPLTVEVNQPAKPVDESQADWTPETGA